MNFILKIIQGPNAGAEIALVAGTTVSFGRGESCDIVLGDQMLPEKAGELVVEENQVSLKLPDGGQETLSPLHVKVLETTALAIGPADEPWGALVWPDPAADEAAVKEAEPDEASAAVPASPGSRKLQWTLLALLILVVLLEFVAWLFWPWLNGQMLQLRAWWQEKSEKWFVDKRELAAQPFHRQTLEELADAYKVEVEMPSEGSGHPPILRGNLLRRADRLELTAKAYNSFPGIDLDLSDDESLRNSADELLNMVTEGKVKVVEAANRHLALAGALDSPQQLRRMLDAIQADVLFAESVDCSQVTLPVIKAPAVQVVSVLPAPPEPAVKPEAPAPTLAPAPAPEPTLEQEPTMVETAPVLPQLPVVGLLTTPYRCLVMRDGSRVLEGGQFYGFTVVKIAVDAVVLRQGDFVLEWKP